MVSERRCSMGMFVFSVVGAVLVYTSSVEGLVRDVLEADIYTDHLHFQFIPTIVPAASIEGPAIAQGPGNGRAPRSGVEGPPEALEPAITSEQKDSLRAERGRSSKSEFGEEVPNGKSSYSVPTKEHVQRGLFRPQRPTSKTLRLEDRFRVSTIDDPIDAYFGKYDPDAPAGSWIDPLSVGELPPPRVQDSQSSFVDSVAMLSELGSEISADDEGSATLMPLDIAEPDNSDVNPDDLPSLLNFRDHSLVSIADHQRQQKAEDLLPPRHEKMFLSADATNPHDALHMRQVGPLCGIFENPLLQGELRAINESAFLLRNVYINSFLRYDHLKVAFAGPDVTVILNLELGPSDKLSIHSREFVLDTTMILPNLDNATLEDNFKHFTTSVDISGCKRPTAVWGSVFLDTKSGVSTGQVVLHTANLMVIKRFTYPGTCPAAYFWAGNGNDPENGFKVPTLNGSYEPLRSYDNEDVILKLPDAITFYDLDYLGVYCPQLRQMLGHHVIKSSLRPDIILPPAFTTVDRILHRRIWA